MSNTNYMRLFCVLLIGIMLPWNALGIDISQIYYDADGTDDGFEFIELYNDEDSVIDLRDASLYTASDEWELAWNGTCENCFLFPDQYVVIGENESYDILVDLDLQNTKGSVKVVYNEEIIVGYGDAVFYSGSPAQDVTSGNALIKVNDSGSNAIDYQSSEPIFRNLDEDVLLITVENAEPILKNITSYAFRDNVSLSLIAEDDNGIEDLSKIEANCDGSVSEIHFAENVSVYCDNNLSVRVLDSNLVSSDWLYVNLMKPFFEVVSITGCSALPGSKCDASLLVLSQESAKVNVSLNGLYGLHDILDIDVALSEEIEGKQEKNISFGIDVPKGTRAGSYQGMLEIVITP